ncbi:hypothetical protein A9Q79_07490 [Methylophaga sp. 42_25_T18]|nr:hypothetical protein A9Q79_07490 [Methylophaga sp. 42_25_T18]OUR88740.1 hypothetical protein A9Q92_02570 [Methylophaga sp. 42_8_T64]
MKKIIQITIALIFVSIASIFLSLLLWQGLIGLVKLVQELGFNIRLVGSPQGIDPGAVIIAVIFFTTWVFAAWHGFKKDKKHLGYTFALCAPISAFFVFVQISSLAWY